MELILFIGLLTLLSDVTVFLVLLKLMEEKRYINMLEIRQFTLTVK